ncbi:hypothetical protein [Mesorhizobium sp. B1-1-5]|uniref:hypothetical protein n=1 Tax=Mesorhizobium sp. B1-1-5 TaxID=2589979 RepID=UPI00112E38B2|nr:hypothetical protein [Mesorhizobium sp. B1-1-5]TPO13738.1 hypothetical protein FJ980_00755 [Mesorhizobium sp. B1-1-5]
MNKITRREFLGGVGATVLATTSGHADEQPAGPHFVHDLTGFVVRRDGADVLRLDPERLLPGATRIVQTTNELTIVRTIRDDLRRIDFILQQSGHGWTISGTWRFGRSITAVAVVPLPEQPKAVRFSAKLIARKPAELVARLFGGQVTCPNRASLVFDTASQETALEAEGRQLFAAFGNRFFGRRLLISHVDGNECAQLTNDETPAEFDLAKSKYMQLHLRAATGVTATFWRDRGISLKGPFDLLIHSPRCEATQVRCQLATRTSQGRDQHWSIQAMDDLWRLNTPKTSFEAKVAEDGIDHVSTRPIEVTASSGKLKSFSMDVRLMSTTLALDQVDRTRFDLGGAALRLLHASAPPAKTKVLSLDRPSPVFAYATPDSVLRIPLPDRAKLRLWRGQDLLCLSFQFHNIDLSINKSVELVPLHSDQMDSATEPDEAVLLAEFPPQHIMERSFLRQEHPLPDAGDAVPQAQLRLLQGLSPTSQESQKLRQAIQDEKTAKEQTDGGYSPFAQFANQWDQADGQKFGVWIGPTGLFTVEARRAARVFAVKNRRERLDKLISKKDTEKFTAADFDEAAETLARPVFPMSRSDASDWVKNNKSGAVTRPDDVDDLWKEASARSDDFRDFQNFDPEHPIDPNNPRARHPWILLPSWPFSEEELQSIWKKAGLKLPDLTPPQKEQQERGMQAALIERLEKFRRSQSDTLRDGDSVDEVLEGFRRPVEAWISEPSRLAFSLANDPIPLTVESLTAWEKFELRVVQRASRQYLDRDKLIEESRSAEILTNRGIKVGEKKTGDARVREIAALVQQPSDFHTALEIPTGLILSPAQDARWITPKGAPRRPDCSADAPALTQIWQARLFEQQKVSSLRAIWSEHFEEFKRDTFLKSASSDDLKQLERWQSPSGRWYRTAMSPQDQAELVALTSMYGLPVIASKDKEVSSQIAPPSNDYITDSDPKTPIAIYLPVPLRTRRLALGATGAMLDLDTTFPLVTAGSANGSKNSYFRSYSLQHWRELISDGSDIITTVVRRGYLFPLCHKASLVKVTEPRLRPIDPKRPSLGYSVEQATRIYIEVTQASHQYPAVAQSFEGRDFQPREISLLTLRTPDLVDPLDDKPLIDPLPLAGTAEDLPQNRLETINRMLGSARAGPHGRIRGWVDRRAKGEEPRLGQLAGIVFWPRTDIGTKGTVRFRMRVDGQPTPISMALIFADHRAASDPATLEALTKYYGGEKPESDDTLKPSKDAKVAETGESKDLDKPKQWNKVEHNGALRTYADEQRKGQCTFVTDWQLLEAVKGDSEFAFNSELVAAEQPPFYPRMTKAQIRPQQIQGLTGSAAPVLEVEYEKNYVYNGFNPPEYCGIADPETFLRVTNDPLPKLNMGDHGDQAGTVARPAKVIYGLNRRFGIAGPQPAGFKDCRAVPTAAEAPPQDQASTAQSPGVETNPAAGGAAGSPPISPGACSSGGTPRRYDNKELAIGHFGEDATLFGLIKLTVFIEAVTGDLGSHIPLLEEITNFTGTQLLDVAKQLQGPIQALRQQLDENTGSVLFPDFTCALNDLGEALITVIEAPDADQTLSDAERIAKQVDSATEIWTLGQRVVRELETIARTPISTFAERLRFYLISSQQEIAKTFQTFAPWNTIQDQLTELVAEAAKSLPGTVVLIMDAGADANDLAKFSANVAVVAGNPEVWKNRNPIEEITKRVGALPSKVMGLREGPLYGLTKSVISLAEQNLGSVLDRASLGTALQLAVDAINDAEAVQNQVNGLVQLSNSVCTQAIGSLRKLLDAVVDDSSTTAKSAVKTIKDAVDGIKTIRTNLASKSPGEFVTAVNTMTIFLSAWEKALSEFLANVSPEIDATQVLVERAISTIPNYFACIRFDISTVQTVAALNAQRQTLLAMWLDFASLFPRDVPPPALPAGASGLLPVWQDIQKQMIELLRSAMLDAETIALRSATSDGQALWKAAIDELAKLVKALPPEMQGGLTSAIDAQGEALKELEIARNAVETQLVTIASAQSPNLAAIQKLAGNDVGTAVKKIATEVLRKAEADLFDQIFRPAMANLLKGFKPNLDDAAGKVLNQIAVVYQDIRDRRDQVYRSIQQKFGSPQQPTKGAFALIAKLFGSPGNDVADACGESWEKFILLVPRGDGTCSDQVNDGLAEETTSLSGKKAIAELTAVLAQWQSGRSAPQRILHHIEYFSRIGVRSQITKVLDVESLRQQIADGLANAVPTTRTLKSSLSLPLKETSVGIGTFRPIGNEQILTLGGKATIRLDNPGAPQTEVNGKVTAFELDILSIMTFTFKDGVTYTKGVNDGRGSVNAPLGAEDIKFGDKLSFLADLSRSLSFGGDGNGNGPYTIVHIDNPSIEAGYRIGLPVITLGVTFTNVNFAGAIVLPFSNGSARVRAALGSLDNPFMISAGIYGGSGYMALEASPQGIEAFEASFQFGGVASIGYGPLQGTAYVTTGAFVRKDKLGCTFAALFSAGFTAHIACFGVSAAFTLRLFKRDGDSSVSGEAQLTFKFSVGRFIEVSYTIRVARTMQAGFGGGGKQAAFNMLPGYNLQVAALGDFAPACLPAKQSAILLIYSLSPEETWSDFEAQFDPDFVPEAVQ